MDGRRERTLGLRERTWDEAMSVKKNVHQKKEALASLLEVESSFNLPAELEDELHSQLHRARVAGENTLPLREGS